MRWQTIPAGTLAEDREVAGITYNNTPLVGDLPTTTDPQITRLHQSAETAVAQRHVANT